MSSVVERRTSDMNNSSTSPTNVNQVLSQIARLIESVSSDTRNNPSTVSSNPEPRQTEASRPQFRVSELTLSMSLAIWLKTSLTFVGDVDELFISEVRRSTTDDNNVFDKQRRSMLERNSRYFCFGLLPPVFCFGCTTTGQLTWLVAIFFLHLAGGVRFRVKKIIYYIIRFALNKLFII